MEHRRAPSKIQLILSVAPIRLFHSNKLDSGVFLGLIILENTNVNENNQIYFKKGRNML